ncbi:uncharacterized protein LOC129566069 [Sitodiplosis mosellana]|uniref:uncharacterized protein LOC129566069 n=1 Tax=Sitodiplosis mosellana TaxID=263140 RepID=UPI002444651F|nr:uncharacterized protein LOC129566069 [Sitodiplosis mosellana]
MASSPQKRKFPDVSPEEPVVSRSGRIRKPKVFYDPSESAKRRSLPNTETAKSKKASKVVEAQPEQQVKKLEKSPIEEKEKAKIAPVKAAVINNRRRTICASTFAVADDGTGCIVCGRSDIKKGRFVNCTDCNSRGHFTCLRNDKLFKTADQEHNWQCATCKICKHCLRITQNEQLYKCILCLSSYHLHCSSKFAQLPKHVVKKKFTCGMCMKGLAAAKKPVEISPRSLIPNRKSEGFPGFPRNETVKVAPKPTVATKTIKKIVSFPIDSDATSNKTPSVDRETECSEQIDFQAELEIKREKSTPSPEREAARTEPFFGRTSVESNGPMIISVRTDLVEHQTKPTKIESDLVRPESDDEKMDIEYDTKTIIKPHESIPDVRKWDCDEVYTYFTAKAPQFAQLLKDNQIDGDALLLIKREDVLNRFNLKLGPALRLYMHIVELQYKNNNPILAWNEF